MKDQVSFLLNSLLTLFLDGRLSKKDQFAVLVNYIYYLSGWISFVVYVAVRLDEFA